MEEGQNIEVKIESIDLDERRISLIPTDYVSPENKDMEEQAEYKSYVSGGKKKIPVNEIGGLGELLKAKLAEKKDK